MFKHYDGVLKIEGEVGDKKIYDPRSYLKAAEASVATRLGEACDDLLSTGKTICGKV
jgi:fructose-bisphosphate aldolase class II